MNRPVVTLGEAMIRLSPSGRASLEQSDLWEVYVGGAEANFAVALARLGMHVQWISKVTRNPLGKKIVGKIREHGVDVSKVIWTDEGRVGIFFAEPGPLPESWMILYDRKGSAMSHVNPEEVDWESVRNARLIHLTGITPALSEGCLKVVERAISEAKKGGALVSFDTNYRAKLWSAEEALAILARLLQGVDLLIASLRDIQALFKGGEDGEVEARKLYSQFRPRVVVVTLGEKGALAYDGERVYQREAYPTQVIDRIGRGDAFDAGFVYGYLTGDIDKGLMYGNALAALAQTRPGDLCWFSQDEIHGLIQGTFRRISR